MPNVGKLLKNKKESFSSNVQKYEPDIMSNVYNGNVENKTRKREVNVEPGI